MMGDPFESFGLFDNNDPVPMPPQDDDVIDESQIPPQPEEVQNNTSVQTETQVQEEAPVTATRIPKSSQKAPVQSQPVVQQPVPIKTDGSTEQNLAILMNIKDYYTDAEWEQRYKLYLAECGKINTDPLNITSSDIMVAAGRIDALLTPVRADYATMQKLQGHYEMISKLKKEQAYISVVKEGEHNNKKYSIDDKKALATEKVQNDKIEDNLSAIELEDRYAGRFIQVKTIIDTLSDKKDLLITFSAALKIENTANNFTASVPTNNQVNQMRK